MRSVAFKTLAMAVLSGSGCDGGGAGGGNAAGGAGGAGGLSGILDGGPGGAYDGGDHRRDGEGPSEATTETEAGESSTTAPACQPVGAEVRITDAPGRSSGPVLLRSGAGYLLVWADERTGAGDIYAVALAADGSKKGDETAIVDTPASSQKPSLLATQDGYLLVWQDQTAHGFSVVGRPLDRDGRPAGAATELGQTTGTEARPVLAPAFGDVALSYMNTPASGAGATVARLTSAGQTKRPPDPVQLGTATSNAGFPSLASHDSALGAAYSDARDGHFDIRLSLLDESLVVTRDVVVRNATGDAVNAQAIWDGRGFLVAWEDERDTNEQVFAARVLLDGTFTPPFRVNDLASGGADWPHLATDGSRAVVAYYQFRGGPPQIVVSALGPDAKKRGGDLQLSHADTGKARFPSIAYGASEYGVAWEDTRFGDAEIYFARVRCP